LTEGKLPVEVTPIDNGTCQVEEEVCGGGEPIDNGDGPGDTDDARDELADDTADNDVDGPSVGDPSGSDVRIVAFGVFDVLLLLHAVTGDADLTDVPEVVVCSGGTVIVRGLESQVPVNSG
jgi:hypothetical protein